MTRHTDAHTPPSKKPAFRWRRMFFWLRAVFVVCLLPLAFAVAAAVMMIDRDITAPTWVKERIEARADDVLAGASLEFGDILVRIGRDLHPRVRLVDTHLIDATGATVTRVPLIEGLISPRGVVLEQDVLMQEVRVVGAQMNLRRAANGELSFVFAGSGVQTEQAPSMPALLDQFEQLFQRPGLNALEVVQAEGLIVNFADARAGRSWTIDGGRAMLDLRDGKTQITGDFSLLSGRADVTTLQLSYRSPRDSRAADISVSLVNAVAGDIATQTPALTWLRDIDAPITATLRTTLDDLGMLGPLNATLDIGSGQFQPTANTLPVRFDAASAYFTYDPVRDLIAFSDMRIDTEWGQFAAEGTAYLREFRDGMPAAALAQLQFRDLTVNPPGFFEAAPTVPLANVDLRARFDPFHIEIGQLVVRDGASQLVASADVSARDDGWYVDLDAKIDQITPERLLLYWPVPLKPRSRDWVAKNVLAGDLRNIAAGIRVRPQNRPRLAISFEFTEAAIKFMRFMPPITRAAGVGNIAEDRFVISVDKGVVLAPEGGPLDIAGSDFTIPDMRLKPANAVLDLQVDSAITSALSVLDQPPLEYMQKADLPVTLADGRARTSGRITWPLMPRPDPDSIEVAMTSQLRAVRSDQLLPDRMFIAPSLDVVVSREGVNIAGPVQIGQVTAIGAWEQRFGDSNRPGSRVLAQVDLSQEFLDEFNIALPPGTISGRGKGEIAISLQDGRAPSFSLTSDMAGLRVAVPAIGWAKGQNTRGNLRVEGRLGAVPAIDRLAIAGGGLDASGTVTLRSGGGLASAAFSRVRIGDWFDAPVTLRGRGRRQPIGVEIAGGQLDLRRATLGAGQGDGGPITLRLDRLQVTEGIALTDFRGDFDGAGGFQGNFSGALNGAVTVTGSVAPQAGRSAIRLRSNDAGAALRAAGFMQNARGGSLDLSLLGAARAGTFDGALAIRSLRVRDAPTIAALLDAISVVGLLQQLDGQGLAFEEVDARFRLTPTQVIVAEASAVGPGLGISVDGTYTLGNKQIDLQGVVSPFYLVNSIGSFLTRKGEGLIGFNYNIAGNPDAPQVSVNPLSALTPGMFREIFRRPAPDLSR